MKQYIGSKAFWVIIALGFTLEWLIVGSKFYFPCLCDRATNPLLQCVICFGFPIVAIVCCVFGLRTESKHTCCQRILQLLFAINALGMALNLLILFFVSHIIVRWLTLAVLLLVILIFAVCHKHYNSIAFCLVLLLASCRNNSEIVGIPPPPSLPIPVGEDRQRVNLKLAQVVRSTNIPGVYQYFNGRFSDALYNKGLDVRDIPKPEDFELTPAEIDFIYSNLLNNAVHWGESNTGYLFFDDKSYYVSDTWPGAANYDDAQTMIDSGVRINGKDGTVYNRKTRKWEAKGYIHRNGDELKKELSMENTQQEVNRKLGKQFLYRDYGSYSVMHYWAKDGEVVLTFEQDKLTKIDTQVKLGRH